METGTELNTTYTNSTTLELHTQTKTQNTNTLEILLWTKRLVPGNDAKFAWCMFHEMDFGLKLEELSVQAT